MLKQFAIEKFGSRGFYKRLGQVALPYAGNTSPVGTILEVLKQPPLSCRSVVFEYDYVDKDYQSEFAVFYSKAFKKYPHRAVRLHFFRPEIPRNTKKDFGRYGQGTNYLGFTVIRPTDLQRAGRTVVQPGTVDPNRQFVHCQATYSAHFLGDKFEVRGMPFTQQDTQVGACAQASLWMLARYMSQRYGHREFLPAEINQLAKTNIAMGRPLPAERGLTDLQMLDALQEMGFPAVNYADYTVDTCSMHIETAFPVDPNASKKKQQQQLKFQRIAKLADIAYHYIESGLPVIFSTVNHALVGIGHTYDATGNAAVAIQRIPAFVVNNDAAGPYREMALFSDSSNHLSFLKVESLIAVVPPEVSLLGEEAEARAMSCIEAFIKSELPFADLIAKKLRPDLADCLPHLEYRTYLRPSVEFQADIRRDIQEDRFDGRLGDKIVRLDYPKYIWVTEVSSSRLLNRPKREDRTCLGRIIIDSTAPAGTNGEMVIHFVDFLLLHDRQTGKQRWSHCPNTTPFAHKLLAE